MNEEAAHRAPIRARARVLVLAAAVAGALLVAVPATATPDGADTSTAPWIASDKPDYAPGERVTLDGGNWQPGESVRVEVEDDQGRTWQRDVTVVADGAGTISDSFNLPDWFVATYSVRATGSSGATAAAGFTDGNVQVTTNAGGPAVTVSYARYTAANCSGAPFATGTATASPTSGVVNVFAQNTGSFKLEVPASSGGQDFDEWTAQANFSSTSNPLCFNAISGNRTFTANYAAAPARETSTALASSSNPSTYGGSVTFTATLTADGGGPDGVGSVTFRNGATALCSAVALSGNTATCTTSGLSAAASPHAITAEYSGTAGGSPQFEPSTSATLSQVVHPKPVDGSFTAADKVYDGTADAEITGRALTGAIAGDDVSLSGGTASFDDANAGQDKPVAGTGFTLAGEDAANYTLASVAATSADIDPLAVAGSFSAADRVYDGTADAEITGRALTGAIAGDDVSLSGGTASFDDANAGQDKPVAGTGFTLAGAHAQNYTLLPVAGTTADITPKALDGSFTADDKVYDGTRDATVAGTSLPGVIGEDDVTLFVSGALFDTKDAGTGKDVTGDLALAGGDAANYTVNPSHTTQADITPKPIAGSFTAADKVYDGTADAEITGRFLDGAIAGDDVALSGGSASFDDESAGEDKPVTGTGFALAGADEGNYTLGSVAGTTATIEPRELTVTASGVDKVYDGTAAASATFTDDRVPGDALTIAYEASFADKHVGDDKPVSVTGISLAGAHAGNYTLTATTASTTADITPRALVVTATGVDKVYDGTTGATVTLSDDRVSGDELDVSYATAAFADADAGTGKAIDVGGISVTGADAGNYTHNTTAVATADIAPRPITVTAAPKSKPFGAPDPAFTYTVSGGPLVAGDGFSGSLTRVAGEAVGGYDVLQGTVSAGPNYAIAYVGATLTIGAWHAVGFHQPIGTGNSQFVPAPGLAPHVGTAVWNTAKGGSTIPLKFDLFTAAGGDERTSTADVKGFQAVRLTGCASGGGEEAVEFVTTGTTSLRYDGTAGQFVQNWRSPSVSGEECYRVSVRFQDESAVYAFVKLRR